MIRGFRAGIVTLLVVPALPAAATTTMPLRHATSVAHDSGSSQYGSALCVPNARLITRMFMPLSWRCCTTQSMPAITCDTSTLPSKAPTRTLTIRLPGATPTNFDESDRSFVPGSRPAAMLARWVPWP